MKPLIALAAAEQDVEDSAEYYAREAGEQVALDFAKALSDAYRAISNHPATGSPRYAHVLGIPGLRSRKLARFPFLIFYLEQPAHIDVVRLLHAKRDIPAWLSSQES